MSNKILKYHSNYIKIHFKQQKAEMWGEINSADQVNKKGSKDIEGMNDQLLKI